MKLLQEWLNSQGIEVVHNRVQPDGARRLNIKLADGKSLEVVLTRQMLRGTRQDTMTFIGDLIRLAPQPRKVRR